MAELDDKLLKNLDKTLESMNERLITLETTLSGVKNGLNKTFDPSIITSFSDALRGIKTLRLIDAEKASQDINKVKDTLAKLQDAYQKWEGGELALSPKALSNLTDLLAKYKELNKNIDKGSEQRSVELANAAKKEADAVEAEERRKQKEFQKTANEQAKLLKAYSDIEQARSVVTGGKKFGELDAEQTKKYKEFGRTLDDLKKKMDDLEKASPGSKAAGTQIFKEQEAVTKAKREAAEEQTRIKKEQAEQERQINEAIKEEERRRAAENKRMLDEEKKALADYIRLFSEKHSILKNVAPLDAKVIRNQPLTEQERGLYDASWNRIYAIQDQMAKLRESYVSVLEYEEKIQANGQEQVALGKVRLTQEQALAKEKEKQAKSESKQQSDEAKIQRQADAIVKKRIDLERQVQRIDNDRAIRQQTNSKISQQALDAENAKYLALFQRIDQLDKALAKLEGKQAGVTARAEQRNAPYMNYVAAAEEERKAKAIENSTKKLKEQKNTLDSMLPTLQRLASAFGVAFSVRGLAQFGKKLIETRGEFEMQFVAMKQIIGDVDAATKIWNQTMQQALRSPFTAMQLTKYTKQLAAYRIETDKLFETTKRLADVSAGLGVDMQRLILAYGQVKAANFLRASEIRQFTEAGVNIVVNLAQYFSELEGRAVSTAEVMERVTKRMVSFADVEGIFKRMTDEGGEFYNMQEVQADTVKGQINKLHDAYDQMLNTIGQANQGTIRKFVEILNNMVRNWRDIVPLIKSSVAILGTYVAVTKLARMGTQKYGDAIVRLRLGKKKQTVEMEAALVKETLLLNRQAKTITAWQYQTQKAIFNVKMAWKALGGIFKSFAPFLAIEGALYTFNKIMEPIREARRLTEDLANIRVENKSRADEDVNNYDKLIRRFNELNRGSIERKEIIDKLNSQYGKYLGFIVDETTAFGDLEKAQERVNLNIRERARLRAEEEAQQRIQEDYMQREAKLLKPKQAWGIQGVYSFLYEDPNKVSGKNTQWIADAENFAEFAKTKIHDLTDEELKSRQELVNATTAWLNTFYGVSGATDISSGLVDLVELYAEQERELRDERKKISEDLKGLPLQVQEDILSMESEWATAMQKLTKAGKGDEVEIPLLNVKLKVPTDLAEKSGVWDVIKEELNKRKEEFKINLKLEAGLITEEQAEELRKQGKSTGSIFIDAVNKELAENILKDAGIEKSFEELKNDIFYNPQNIDDWDNVKHVIELINGNLINASDIVNGTTSYTKELVNNLQVARDAINDAVKAQELVADGTQKEKEDAQKLVDKTIEHYKWLLKIAKLLGLDTKAVDEIVAEQGYDLSVGQFRLAAAQQAFMEKFGVASNTYGKQLSKIGVTDNLKDVADAYHKQSEELDVLIRNQEKALENETNLTEEQKKNAQTTIDNLKKEKSFAEFLAEFFGYVLKKTTTRTTHENASKLISLIKEMRSEYDKLSKSAYGYAKSEEKVREAYKDSVKEILGKAGITDYDFTTNEGMIKALEKVKSYATKLGKDAAAEVQKYIDQLETEIEINAQVRIREDFGKQIEDMFNNYELTLELQKLNIPADAAKDLFPDFTEKTLGDLQKRLREFYEERQKKDEKGNVLFSEEDLKEYRKWADKIDAEILKERKEKAKEYSKYLEKEYSERAKLEMQHAKDVAFVTANVVDDNQRKTILANIEKKYQDDLNELKWKSFKESSFYVDMMDDIASLPAEYTRMMLDKINEILEHPEKLSPRALKEAVNARQKVIEAQIATKPLTVMTNAGKEIREARKLLKQDEEITVKWWESTRRALDEQIKTEAESIAKDEKKINSLQGLQGELAGYERLLENLKEATLKVDSEGLNKLMGLDLGKSVSELSPEEIEDKIEELKTLLDSQRSLYDATEKTDEQNARAVEIEQIEKLIETLRGELEARKALASFNLSNEAKEALGAGETSSTIGSQISGIETSKEGKQKRLTTWKEYRKQFKNFSEAFADFNKNVNGMVVKVRDMGNAWYDMFDALGGETNVLTDGWKEFGNTITDVFTQTLTLIPQMIVAFQAAGTSINASLGVIGLIAEAVQLVFVAIGAFAKLHDARYEREIEIQQKKIDDLQRAYDRLEKSIEKAFDTVSYIREYNQEVQNLNEQYEALAKQIDAEKAKKNVDEDKLQDYADKQQEIIDNLEEIKQQQIDTFGGIGEDNYSSAAEGFVDAWKSAFLETGDGLQGLQDHFDEFLSDWFVKQATMRIAANNLAPLFQKIDQAVDQYGVEGANVTWQELQEINDLKDLLLTQTNEQLKELAGVFGLGGEGSLSGLAAGIQGMTEEHANILEAYWNQVRMDTKSIADNVARLLSDDVNTNPMLQQLTLIAANTQATHQLLQSVTKSGHSQGGYGIKVFAD